MRISYLAATALAVCLLPLGTSAYAGCNGTNCATSGKTITYGSGSYGAASSSSNYGSNSHVSQGISTRFGTSVTAACPSGATRSTSGYCTSADSNSSVSASRNTSFASGSAYGTSRVYGTSSHASGQIVPFTTTVNKISNYRVAGMAQNEFLSPTTCPTNVYNPDGAKVLGCYSVVKPVQAVRPVQVVRPVPQIRYQQVRVVRPIIYVRYPVPVPLPMPVPVCRTQTVCNSGCNSNTTYSRNAYTWPQGGNNCGRWY